MNKLLSIQFLRAFASLLVVFSHVLQALKIMPFGNYYISGVYGVDLFFIISGFLIYLTTKENDNWKNFALKRFFRIYPLYWFAFIIFLVYEFIKGKSGFSLLFYVQNIFMLPWSGELTTKSLLIGVAWSTVYEVYFYAIFIILLIFRLKKNHIIPLLLILLIGMKIIHSLQISILVNSSLFQFIYSVVGKTFIIPFIVGILIAKNFQNPNVVSLIRSKQTFFKILFFGFNILFLLILLTKYSQYKSYLISTIIFCLWLFVDTLYNFNYETKISKFIIMLGDISFSIYLLHIIVIEGIIEMLQINNLYTLLILTLFVTVLLSYSTYSLIEKPFINLSKSLVTKKSNNKNK
jgi:peptidoglycan/LPS O-acetylase OafA/YrhL